MIKFTSRSGNEVFVKPTEVVSVREYVRHTLISFSNGNAVVVKESVETVINKLKG